MIGTQIKNTIIGTWTFENLRIGTHILVFRNQIKTDTNILGYTFFFYFYRYLNVPIKAK